MGDTLPLVSELRRKTIHLSTSIIPLVYFFYPKREQILLVCIMLVSGFLLADVLRIVFGHAKTYFLRFFSGLLRQSEKEGKLTGATWLFIGILVTILVFPVKIAVPAMLLLTLSDPIAAIFGKHWGNIRVLNKTIEGSLAFFVVSVIIITVFFGLSWKGIAVAFVATLTELITVRINDNLLIPVISGAMMYLLL